MKHFNFILVLLITATSFSCEAQKKTPVFDPLKRPKNLSDTALIELVQKQTFRYFWDFAHPVSGLSRERSNENFGYGNDVVTSGGTGFGVMSVIVAAERNWISRDTAAKFLLKMVNFLLKADSYHGVFPHWMNGSTGKTIPFSRKDDGADLVESSYLFQGLLCARQYFNNKDNRVERELRSRINWLWEGIEWNWFTQGGQEVLYWHWSPNNGWAMNFPVRGFNECLIMYVLASAGDRYPVSSAVYHRGWAESNFFTNGKTFYGYKLPLGFDYGGPLFFSQYSFLGLDPRGLKDRYADYWEQNQNHTLINYSYCVDNPKQFKGYGPNCWGLTAGDTYDGYNAYSPTNDAGTITPTAALSAFPYTPDKSMKALRHFYDDLGNKIWSEYGFVDAFNETKNWYAESHLAIDQGPIIVMMENYRTGLLWKLFMSCPEIQAGLKKFDFRSPWLVPQKSPAISD
ncbi:glucoamylase family protein [Ferruginibacter sp. HRS2-29]|uniref:glucoamylase family protein n=1 Tax=Ferruginibacter sp. HRS2-29 TaxID=2487334 RepID=UPI0020CCDE6D|nr:glucoamylase family protein [Ferruginibacter sp. HRS2-29]MCP9749716.1 beta-glucosidase [Ferruginibacter sp. HRS2-29]